MSLGHHSIQSVAQRTGLSPHVIRVWEKRYGAVKPSRTATNRRRYSDGEVARLNLLRRATEAGHSIGAIAGLDDGTLGALAAENVVVAAGSMGTSASIPSKSAVDFTTRCLDAAKALDSRAFEDALQRGAVALGNRGLLEHVIAPVAEAIGRLWRDGTITAAHEHFASAAIRAFLTHASRSFALPANAPHVVVATPAGQLHELGAIMVAAAASDLGWRVIYLGTSLPAAEIAGSAVQGGARAVVLSIVYPGDDEYLPEELERLRRYLPSEVEIIVGGRASAAYGDSIRRIGALHPPDLKAFCDQLDLLRALPARKLTPA